MDPDKTTALAVAKYIRELAADAKDPQKATLLEEAADHIVSERAPGAGGDGDLKNSVVSLREGYVAGCEALRGANESARVDANEAGLQKFLDRLKSTTDFFSGVEEGSAEYNSRVARARAKFMARVTEKQNGSKGTAPASMPRASAGVASQSASAGAGSGGLGGVSPDKKKEADELKAQGNACLKASDYEGAYRCYTRAIALDDTNAVYFSNRAASLMHLKRYSEAVTDCKQAIALNGSFVRPRERLASAYRRLGMHAEEVAALKEACEVDPANAQLQSDLAAAMRRGEGAAGNDESSGAAGGVGGGATVGNAPGGPDMMSMLQSMMGGGAGGAGGAGGGSGGPDMMSMMQSMLGGGDGGGGGGGGEDGMAGLMRQMGNNPLVKSMMENPEMLRQVASDPRVASMLQNPEFAKFAASMMGGGGAPGGR